MAEKPFFSEVETAIEVDEEGLPLLREKDIPFVSQVQVDDPSLMNLPEHLF